VINVLSSGSEVIYWVRKDYINSHVLVEQKNSHSLSSIVKFHSSWNDCSLGVQQQSFTHIAQPLMEDLVMILILIFLGGGWVYPISILLYW